MTRRSMRQQHMTQAEKDQLLATMKEMRGNCANVLSRLKIGCPEYIAVDNLLTSVNVAADALAMREGALNDPIHTTPCGFTSDADRVTEAERPDRKNSRS